MTLISASIGKNVTDLADTLQREQALDPRYSFIVQAPAGSGKTELLTQRVLTLLSIVKEPEEILALTFTRKAAGEMHHRIFNALHFASTTPAPTAPHAQHTWQLARKVLERDQQQGWQLLQSPHRLRIQTIDGLCASLTQRMPLFSRTAPTAQIATYPLPYYRKAAANLCAYLADETHCCAQALTTLLLYWDNQVDKLQQHFVTLLTKREQWLPYILAAQYTDNLRNYLEKSLLRVNEETLQKIKKNIPLDVADELLALLKFSATQLQAVDYLMLTTIPAATIEHHPTWLAIANLLLTKEGEWRKQINKNIGFPAASDAKNSEEKKCWQEMKQRLQALLTRLADEEKLRQALGDLATNPPWQYNQEQWGIIEALTHLLPKLAAELNVVFAQHNSCDFSAIATDASSALGDEENPTDLALYLDHKIQHLLIDEFQDTSIQQFNLLTKLTAGWMEGDGRTLFLVGDPMQSIYRFRQADVGLFLQARQQGIGICRLHSLTLSTNFRSTPEVIRWINQNFSTIFPKIEDKTTGAIRYTAANTPKHENNNPDNTQNSNLTEPTLMKKCVIPAKAEIHFNDDTNPEIDSRFRGNDTLNEKLTAPQNPIQYYLHTDKTSESTNIVSLIKNILNTKPNSSIGILVRTRSQLTTLLPLLKQAQISFNAVELESLGNRPTIQDLFALTRALLHPADRIAWFSILRAPWCGLTLNDLHILSTQSYLTLFDAFNHLEKYVLSLSTDGQQRLKFTATILINALQQRNRHSLRQWLEQTWHALGGPDCLQTLQEKEEAQAFFELIESLETAGPSGELLSSNELLEQIKQRYLSTHHSQAQVHLMTIHKAKGLEFDTVIIPGLEKLSRASSSELILWLERPTSDGHHELLLAPIKSAEESSDPIYKYLSSIEKQKESYEDARLLYVAATRARQNLHLFATLSVDEAGEIATPRKNSFLGLLWPELKENFLATAADTNNLLSSVIPAQARIHSSADMNVEIEMNSRLCRNDTEVIEKPIYRLPISWFENKLKNQRSHSVALGVLSLSKDHHAPPSCSQAQREGPSRVMPPLRPPTSDIFKIVGTIIHEQLYLLGQQGIQQLQLHHFLQKEIQWQQRLQAAGYSAEETSFGIQQIKKALENVFADKNNHWIFEKHYSENACEYAMTTVIDNVQQSLIIDRTFVNADNIRWIIDYKTSQPAEGQLIDDFLNVEQQKHQKQLARYEQALKQLNRSDTTSSFKLGLYYPLIPVLAEYSDNH